MRCARSWPCPRRIWTTPPATGCAAGPSGTGPSRTAPCPPELTALLHDHITIAVELLQAAKNGDAGTFEAANARWQANANDIADFLSAAMPLTS